MQVRDETLPGLIKQLGSLMTTAKTEAHEKHKGFWPFANSEAWIADPSVAVYQHTKDTLTKLTNDINAALNGGGAV